MENMNIRFNIMNSSVPLSWLFCFNPYLLIFFDFSIEFFCLSLYYFAIPEFVDIQIEVRSTSFCCSLNVWRIVSFCILWVCLISFGSWVVYININSCHFSLICIFLLLLFSVILVFFVFFLLLCFVFFLLSLFFFGFSSLFSFFLFLLVSNVVVIVDLLVFLC